MDSLNLWSNAGQISKPGNTNNLAQKNQYITSYKKHMKETNYKPNKRIITMAPYGTELIDISVSTQPIKKPLMNETIAVVIV
jgi:hypothetical protein